MDNYNVVRSPRASHVCCAMPIYVTFDPPLSATFDLGKMATTGVATKEAKPTLGGTKFKTRKRDEKVKLDVTSFSEQLISGLKESGGNLDDVRQFLDRAGSQLDYRYDPVTHVRSPVRRVSVRIYQYCRRYGEPLLDILVAGGVLAPGGGKVEGTAVSPVSVFSCEPMVEALRGHLVVSI